MMRKSQCQCFEWKEVVWFYWENKTLILTKEKVLQSFIGKFSMLCEIGTESIDFKTTFTEPPPTPLPHSPSLISIAPPTDLDRVVKNTIDSPQGLKMPKKPQKTRGRRGRGNLWRVEQEMEYFYAVIRFTCEYPYLTLSWEWWKPKRFYNFLQAHMKNVFGQGNHRSNLQCKTKDQNLKIQNYEKRGHSIDLVDLAQQRLSRFLKQSKLTPLQISALPSNNRLHRFQDVLNEYKEYLNRLSSILPFEMELQNLMEYNKLMFKETETLWKKL